MKTKALLVLAFSIWTSVPALAAESGDPKAAGRHYRKGTTEYNIGHFENAIAEFEKAYAISPQPILLYNIAQSHRQLGNHERALFFYRRYLEGAPNAPNRADIERRMHELEATLKAQNEPRVQPPAESPEATRPATVVAAPPPPPPTVEARRAPPPPPSDSGRSLRIAGLASAGVGAAAVVTGLVFGLQARSKSDSVSKATRFDPDADSAGRSAQTLQYVFYGIGGAAIATGAVLYYFGMDQREQRVSVAPTVTPAGFGLVARGAF
jgi:tetratricopeptide (TPR) repeat protein